MVSASRTGRFVRVASALFGFAGVSAAQTPAFEPQALLDRYCITCHNQRIETAGLALDTLDLDRVATDAETWERVVRKVGTGMMPPAGAPRPERADLDRLQRQIEDALDTAAAMAPSPGAPLLHRLNRTEYANAVRDLLDLPVDATTLFPGDDSSEGFDNIANVLSVSPALMQAYISSAAKISRLAVGDPTTSPARTTYRPVRGLSQDRHIEGLGLGTRGGLEFEHVFPLDGEYEFSIGRTGVGFGQTSTGGSEEIEISINGERVLLVGPGTPQPIRLRVDAGPQTIGVGVVSARIATGADDLYAELAINPGISNVSVFGPFGATGPGDTPSRRRVFTCRPDGAAEESVCAAEILARLAAHAFRRPVDEADVTMETLMEFFQAGRELRGFETGVQYALARILVDPEFIFRFESEPEDLAEGGIYRLNDFELATRLAFFLWSSIPDDTLLELALAGTLSDPRVLEEQVRRMLADERSRALVDNFAAQWLLLRQLEVVNPTSPDFDGNLQTAFRRETEMLFESILREDRSIVDLLDADYTFVDERLARHYGIPNIRGSRFRRVTIEDDARRGLLGHGSILTVTSAVNRTSPVKRGKWVLENILGTPVPLPPPGVETNLEETASPAAASSSMRQRLERHRADPGCAACHSIMDPIGFALENFDLVGKWRDLDSGVEVDATGTLVDGTRLDGPEALRQALLDRREAFATLATEKLLTYALGRTVEYYDMSAVRAIVREAAREDYVFSSLVLGVVESLPFQWRAKGPGPSDAD